MGGRFARATMARGNAMKRGDVCYLTRPKKWQRVNVVGWYETRPQHGFAKVIFARPRHNSTPLIVEISNLRSMESYNYRRNYMRKASRNARKRSKERQT